jgi:ABC-type nickel/cobalt efflux system permease component RcnA
MDEIGMLSVLGIGFILGIKHALEPDHVIAVSTIASQSKKLRTSSLAGVFWGLGHAATLLIVGMVIILMKGQIADKWAMSLEFLVGIMLVYFGVTTIKSSKNIHVQTQHDRQSHKDGHSHYYGGSGKHVHTDYTYTSSYTKSLFMGFIHGLAGSAAMVLLTMSTANSVWDGAIYIGVFGAGTVVGMLLFTTIIGIPFVLSSKKVGINMVLTQAAGVVSTLFGIYYMYNLGISEGLFKLWIE